MMSTKRFPWLLTLVVLMCAVPAMAQIDRVGTLGDSMTDLENPPGVTGYYPWTKWAAEDIGINFGPWDDYSDFRGSDYQYNYAHGGATTVSMIAEGQHTLLAAETPKVDVASYLNGSNDLAYWMQNHAVLGQDNADPNTYVVPVMVSNFNTAVNTVAGTELSPTGTDMVVWGCPDITKMPYILGNLAYMYPGTAATYRNAATSYNDSMEVVAADRYWVFLDTMAMEDVLCAGSSFTLADVTIPYSDLFCVDGIHPGTVFAGLMANLFTRALNLKYDTDYPLLSDQTILIEAGYSPTEGETYFDVDPYIILNLPEPATISLLLAGFLGMRIPRKRSR